MQNTGSLTQDCDRVSAGDPLMPSLPAEETKTLTFLLFLHLSGKIISHHKACRTKTATSQHKLQVRHIFTSLKRSSPTQMLDKNLTSFSCERSGGLIDVLTLWSQQEVKHLICSALVNFVLILVNVVFFLTKTL